ncbi:hypothetical protein UlMin_017321 [Ulmus minor]
MTKKSLKSLVTAFTPDGDYLAILSPDGTVKIWSTSNGILLAEWKPSDGDGGRFSCMACSFVGKKRKKERGTCLLALSTDDGDVLAVDVLTGEMKWKTTGSYPGGVVGLSFTNKGRSLHVVGTNGVAHEMSSETGELVGEFKASKKPISTVAFSHDEKFLVVAGSRLRVLSLENGKELLKFPSDLGHVQYASISDDCNALVTSGSGDKHLQVWGLDLSAGTVSRGPVLSMKHVPLSFQCKNGCDGERMVGLAVSKSGVYAWNFKTQSEDEVKPTKIAFQANEDETALKNGGTEGKGRVSTIASRLQILDGNKQIKALISYGSIEHPQFSLADISNPGKDIVITASNETKSAQDGIVAGKAETVSQKEKKKANKKRAASDLDHSTTGDIVDMGNGEAADGVLVDDHLNEPTMGEKLANLNLLDTDMVKSQEKVEPVVPAKPPSADSVHVLLKQALHADDRALLLDCLYNQDERVIAKSISLLNPSDVLKLLHSLISIIQSRGAILACALPWLRCLLLQHASGIMSQESSLLALNSLYQLIESRVSTFQSALQLSSVLDLFYTGIVDDEVDESGTTVPVIYEDKDDSEEEEESDDGAMDTDQNSEDDDTSDEESDGISDLEGNDAVSD